MSKKQTVSNTVYIRRKCVVPYPMHLVITDAKAPNGDGASVIDDNGAVDVRVYMRDPSCKG